MAILGVLASVAVLASCASTVKETFYVGRFDPLTQLPEELYRFRLKGSSGCLSSVRFASGWLPAEMVDPLDTQLTISPKGKVGVDAGDENNKAHVEAYRTMRLFGPEGFVEVPKDFRLCVIMGSDPGEFFRMSTALLSAKDTSSLLGAGAEEMSLARKKGIDELARIEAELEKVENVKTKEAK
jgi:hypothetical protein